ncbi:MAG TPA: DedA family protein, partial [Leptospiraceae bacterium]|nr:DedA family protein [Leptospiraceae bacterium]
QKFASQWLRQNAKCTNSMMQTLHNLVIVWFGLVHDWGYGGIVFLMALESSIVPIPSEVVMPPAAFWAAQGKMNFWFVVLAGTVGSYLGSVISYFVARSIGSPLLYRFGKFIFLPPEKLKLAEAWFNTYGAAGIFFARLLPVIRHLISIPAGVFKMNFAAFSTWTIVGAGLWCIVLSWYGGQVLGESPQLLESPIEMVEVLKAKMYWIIAGVAGIAILYGIMVFAKRRLLEKKPEA